MDPSDGTTGTDLIPSRQALTKCRDNTYQPTTDTTATDLTLEQTVLIKHLADRNQHYTGTRKHTWIDRCQPIKQEDTDQKEYKEKGSTMQATLW